MIRQTILVAIECDYADDLCHEAHRVEVEVPPPVAIGPGIDARARELATRRGWTITDDGDYCPNHPPRPPGPDGGVPARPSGGPLPALSAVAEIPPHETAVEADSGAELARSH